MLSEEVAAQRLLSDTVSTVDRSMFFAKNVMRCSVKKLWIWLRHTWLVKFYFVELSERLYFGVFKLLYIHNSIGGFSQLIEMPENNSSNVNLTDAYK